jgi:hypothetical protein
VLAVAFVIALTILLTRPAPPVLADSTPHVSHTEPLPPIVPGQSTVQRFTATESRLAEVNALIGTIGGVQDCTLHATLRADQRVVFDRVIPCRTIPDSLMFNLGRFPAEADSRGREYVLEVSAEPGSTEAVVLWGVPPGNGQVAAVSGGKDQAFSAEVEPRYQRESSVAGTIGLALHRMSTLGAPWRTTVVAIVLAVGALALVVALVATPKRAVWLLVALVLAKGLLWSMALPPLEGVDETAHYGYVEFMAVEHKIPKRGVAQDDRGPGDYSLALYQAYDAFHVTADPPADRPDFDARGLTTTHDLLANADTHAGGNGQAAGYSPVYYAPAAVLYTIGGGTLDNRIGYVRLWSVLLGAVAVWLAFQIGRRLFPSSPHAPTLFALAVALQPMASLTYGLWAVYSSLFGFKFAKLDDLNPTDKPKDLSAYISLLRNEHFQNIRRNWVDQFWGDFSWVDTPLPKWIQNTIAVVSAFVALAVLVWLLRTLLDVVRRRPTSDDDARLAVCIAAVAATGLLLYAIGFSAFRRTGSNDLIQGRYALMVVPAVIAIPALLVRRARATFDPAWVLGLLAAALLLLNATGLGLIAQHFYL